MFAKVFEQIFDSSIADDYLVRLVFEDFLVLADQEGIVDMTPRAIAGRTNVPLEIVTRAIEKLSSPDPESRTPDMDGRRIVLLSDHRTWGWRIVNYETYRNLRDAEGRREYMRGYMKGRRKPDVDSCKQLLTSVNTPLAPVNNLLADVSSCKPPLAKAEAEAEAVIPPTPSLPVPPESVAKEVCKATGLSRRNVYPALCDTCRAEMLSGSTPDYLLEEMPKAWKEYAPQRSTMEYTYGAAKFFSEGIWKDRKLWKRKEGYRPPSPATPFIPSASL